MRVNEQVNKHVNKRANEHRTVGGTLVEGERAEVEDKVLDGR